MAGQCNHDETRLTCVDCGKLICSNCLVQCPVGFRCKPCGGPKTVSGHKPGAFGAAKSLAICAVCGFGYGSIMPFIGVPFFSCVIAFLLGLLCGRFLSGVLDSKLGSALTTTIVFGLMIGMSFTSTAGIAWLLVDLIKAPFVGEFALIIPGLTRLASALFCPVGFIVGVLRMTVWRIW